MIYLFGLYLMVSWISRHKGWDWLRGHLHFWQMTVRMLSLPGSSFGASDLLDELTHGLGLGMIVDMIFSIFETDSSWTVAHRWD